MERAQDPAAPDVPPVRLPVLAFTACAARETEPQRCPVDVDEPLERVLGNLIADALAHTDGARPSSRDGLAVLVIDDGGAVREGVATLLCQSGCRVERFIDGDEALGHPMDGQPLPDLLLADYRLPGGCTGLEAIDVIREEFNDDMPTPVVTGDTSPEPSAQARGNGVPLLHKPVDFRQLLRSMDELMRARRSEEGSREQEP